MKIAFICAVDYPKKTKSRQDEKRYDYQPLLLIDSIEKYNPDADIYVGCFTNRIPRSKPEILKRAESNPNIHYVEDLKFYCRDNVDAVFHRTYCCHYFSHILDLTQKYDHVIYLDVDVLLFSEFKLEHVPESDIVLTCEFNDIVKLYEGNSKRFIDKLWYHNWIQIINQRNKIAFADKSLDYNVHPKNFFGDLFHSKYLSDLAGAGVIRLQEQNIGMIPFLSPYHSEQFCIHYDDFAPRGTFVFLSEIMEFKDYLPFKIKGEKYLNEKCANDVHYRYWRNILEEIEEKYKDDEIWSRIEDSMTRFKNGFMYY